MLLFYFRNVVVLGFTLRSVFHLELISVMWHNVRVKVCLFRYNGINTIIGKIIFS